jgi:putative SOS response-associated peptidase YedK
MSIAGLWENWEGADGQVIESCTILTTSANELMEPIHNRMPVILPSLDEVGVWLDVGRDQREVADLLRPCSSEHLVKYRVSEYLNSVAHTGPECVAPVADI